MSAHLDSQHLRRDALAILQAALAAADAAAAVRRHLSLDRNLLHAGPLQVSLKDFDRIFLVGAGKAAVDMAAAAETIVQDRLTGGVIVTKHGHTAAGVRSVTVIEAGHPIPDDAGVRASQAIQNLVAELNARDLLLVVLSGGASALLSAPAEGLTLTDKQQTTDLLLRAGADIFELNAVRKHISRLKGGQLVALAQPATVVSLLLSDVIGDDLSIIGSGPTAPDPSTFSDAISVLTKFDLLPCVPDSIRDRLERGLAGQIPETPKPGDPLFQNVHNIIVGSNSLALLAAAAKARELGYHPLILSSTMQGETREVARVHARILREAIASGNPVRAPACILSGGETTVTVRGRGKGGRNQEFALAAALEISNLPNALIIAVGTDGTDGPTDAAGAIATGETVKRAAKLGLNALQHLCANNSYPFFDALGDLVKTGPTGTNVMDINLLLAS